MKVSRDYGNGIKVEFEASTPAEAVSGLASVDEIFLDTECAAKIDGRVVKSDKVIFKHRTVDGNDYYEMECVDRTPEGYKLRGFKKELGQNKVPKGNLYPKREPKEGNIPGLNGWSKYVKE